MKNIVNILINSFSLCPFRKIIKVLLNFLTVKITFNNKARPHKVSQILQITLINLEFNSSNLLKKEFLSILSSI
jgi:hypothetical protein